MKKKLERIRESISASMFEIEMIIRSSDDPARNQTYKQLLADGYLIRSDVDNLICKLDCIHEDCSSQLAGDFISRIQDVLNETGEKFDPEKHNAWINLTEILDQNDLQISTELREYIGHLRVHTLKALGHNEDLWDADSQHVWDLKACKTLLVEYPAFLDQLKELARTRGSLEEIIHLVE